jgi:metalloendopeptidase OMA1, mitochondrial
MQRRHLILAPVLLAIVFMLYQYFSAEKFTNAETGERHRVALTTEQEAVLGLDAYKEVLSSARVVDSGPEVEMVKRVASALAKATGEQGASFDWRVSVVQSAEQNAFCLPGGKIVVYTGILPIAKTEAGLATVLGHEMAHATSRHSAQRMLREELAQTALLGAQGTLSNMDPNQRAAVMRALGAGAQFGVILPFSRDHESEADRIGLHYMARAGYDPRESLEFWKRMAELSQGQQPPEFASTHPSHESRIGGLQAEMPKALEEYERAKH